MEKVGLIDPSYTGPVAADYPECLAIVREKVKPSRDGLKRDNYRLKWWQFAERCPGLYKAIKNLEQVFAACKHTKYVILTAVPANMVFNEGTNVFATDAFADFALYQSSIHELWVRKYGSTMKTDIRYSHTDCVETFPRPEQSLLRLCETVGKELHIQRTNCMQSRALGLTDIYNLFHSTLCQDPDISELRRISVNTDKAILAAYGWSDLELNYSFQGTDYEQRYTFSPEQRKQIVARLIALNKFLP